MTTANQERADELAFAVGDLQKFYSYLDELRESGETNMYGAGPYLRGKFGMDKRMSHIVLGAWMKDFS